MMRKIAIFTFVTALALILLQGCVSDNVVLASNQVPPPNTGEYDIDSDGYRDESVVQAADGSEIWSYFEESIKSQIVIVSVENDVDIAARFADDYSVFLGLDLSADDFAIEFVYFSWQDYITNEQLEIVREHLGLPEGGFDDAVVFDYLVNTMGRELVRSYDSTPFEDMGNDPRRIIVRMWEAYNLVANEYRFRSALEQGIDPDALDIYAWGLDRIVTDWR